VASTPAPQDAAPDWVCEAYGPEMAELGHVCFFAHQENTRVCPSQAICREAMRAKRQDIFRRISELAAAGHPEMEFLEGEFSSPDQIQNADEEGL
jgi:hypothetical protein